MYFVTHFSTFLCIYLHISGVVLLAALAAGLALLAASGALALVYVAGLLAAVVSRWGGRPVNDAWLDDLVVHGLGRCENHGRWWHVWFAGELLDGFALPVFQTGARRYKVGVMYWHNAFGFLFLLSKFICSCPTSGREP